MDFHAPQIAVNAQLDALNQLREVLERSGSVAAIVRNEKGWPVDFVSANVERLYGYTVEDVLSPTFRYSEIIHPADLPAVRAGAFQAFKNSAAQSFTFKPYRVTAKDGTVKWLRHNTHVRRGANGDVTHFEAILDDVTELIQTEERLRRTLENVRKGLDATVQAISKIGELRDPYTAGHQKNVATLAKAIGAEMNLPERTCEGLAVMGHLHDIGKIMVPAEILSKPGRLTDVEFQMVKQHAQAGHEILQHLNFPWPVADVVLQHHERLDGTGYPQGLRKGEIIMEARILAVADVVEAMTSHRPYRAGLGIEAALAEIQAKTDSAFDRCVVETCVSLIRGGLKI